MIAASTPLCGVRRTWGHGMGKRIAVLGTGANGAAIGADLAMAGLDIVLIDQWPENVTAMRERGVRVEMPEQTLTVPVRAFNLCDVCTFREPFDIVLMLVKAYDSRWAGDRLLLSRRRGARRPAGCILYPLDAPVPLPAPRPWPALPRARPRWRRRVRRASSRAIGPRSRCGRACGLKIHAFEAAVGRKDCVDEAQPLEQLLPVDVGNQAQAGNDVANGDIRCALLAMDIAYRCVGSRVLSRQMLVEPCQCGGDHRILIA